MGAINIADCLSVDVPVDHKGSITKYANYEGDAIWYGFTQGTINPDPGVGRFFSGYNGTQDQPNGSITNSHIKTDFNMGSNLVMDTTTTFGTNSGEALTPYVLKLTSTGEGNAETDETIYADIVAKDGTKETVTFVGIGYGTTGYKFFKSSIANIDLDHLVLYMNNNEDKSKIKSVSLLRGGASNPNGAYTIPVYAEISQSNPWTGTPDSTVAVVDLKTSTQDNSGTDSGIAMGVVDASGQSLGTTPIRFDTDRNHLESGDIDTAYFSASGLTAGAIAGFTLKSDTGGDNSGWSLESMSNLKLLAAVRDGLSESVTDIVPSSVKTNQWIIQRDYAYTFMLSTAQTRQCPEDFKTSTKKDAGTDSDIQICLYNAAGESSGWIQQWSYNNPSGRDLNEKDDVNSMNFVTGKDLGGNHSHRDTNR
ncbi:hypothetical protein [Eubacterium aggregans]|uniref:hypothetical protein n=1 Tax=Eubacterium aggregans TaxID=81409 RepID=UPI003F3A7DDB